MGRRLQVRDREALVSVARWLLVRRAAWERKIRNPAARLDRTALWRFEKRPRPTISVHAYEALWRMIECAGEPERERERMQRLRERAVMGPVASGVEMAYTYWQQERAGRFMRRKGPRFLPSLTGPLKVREMTEREASAVALAETPDDLDDNAMYYCLFYGGPAGGLRGVHAARHFEWMELREYLGARGFARPLERFGQEAIDKGHSWARVDLAMLRILEPLLEASESAFIERHWRELTADEMRAFIRHGIARERILLNRPPSDERAQAIAKHGPTRGRHKV